MDKILELSSLLRELRSGLIPEEKVYEVIYKFGKETFLYAKRDIELFLTHSDPELRYIALHVLTLDWMCQEHRKTCEEFMLKDPEGDNRALGAAGLGVLLGQTRDPRALRLLLSAFHNEAEDWIVRDSAYSSILYVLGRPVSEQPSRAKRLDYAKDVNWDLIREAEEIAKKGEKGTG